MIPRRVCPTSCSCTRCTQSAAPHYCTLSTCSGTWPDYRYFGCSHRLLTSLHARSACRARFAPQLGSWLGQASHQPGSEGLSADWTSVCVCVCVCVQARTPMLALVDVDMLISSALYTDLLNPSTQQAMVQVRVCARACVYTY